MSTTSHMTTAEIWEYMEKQRAKGWPMSASIHPGKARPKATRRESRPSDSLTTAAVVSQAIADINY